MVCRESGVMWRFGSCHRDEFCNQWCVGVFRLALEFAVRGGDVLNRSSQGYGQVWSGGKVVGERLEWRCILFQRIEKEMQDLSQCTMGLVCSPGASVRSALSSALGTPHKVGEECFEHTSNEHSLCICSQKTKICREEGWGDDSLGLGHFSV